MSNLYEHPLASAVLSAAIDVHRALGPGLLESSYKACLGYEFALRNIPFRAEVEIPLPYKNMRLDCGYRLDFFVTEDLVLEVKAVETILPIHEAQTLTYLRLTGATQAFLMNFNEVTLKKGLRSYLSRELLDPRQSSGV